MLSEKSQGILKAEMLCQKTIWCYNGNFTGASGGSLQVTAYLLSMNTQTAKQNSGFLIEYVNRFYSFTEESDTERATEGLTFRVKFLDE